MRNGLLKGLFLTVVAVAMGAAHAATITVTSPARGSATLPTLVGTSTPIQVRLTGMAGNAQVTAKVFRQSDNSLVRTLGPIDIAPDSTNNGSGSVSLTFATGTEEVVYRVEVRAQDINNDTTYNSDQNLFVKPDTTKPAFVQWNPTTGSILKGIVPIRVRVRETNLKDWRVTVDDQDIANNTGTDTDGNGEFVVNWDTAPIKTDGLHTIKIRVRDDANNESTLTLSVTLDRVAPTVTIQSPINGSVFAVGTTLTLTVDVVDASPTSVDVTGVDVVMRTTAGVFVTRASRLSYRSIGGNTMRWTGRIRWSTSLPRNFTISASAVDRAGNRGVTQTVTCSFGG